MSSGKAKLIAKEVDEQETRLDFSRLPGPVYDDGNIALHGVLIGLPYQNPG
jgi:hypothetical protein